jgi:hypothetical protein
MLRYTMSKSILEGQHAPVRSVLNFQGGQHVPEWQPIPANQATLTLQNIPAFWGSTCSGISNSSFGCSAQLNEKDNALHKFLN